MTRDMQQEVEEIRKEEEKSGLAAIYIHKTEE